MTETPGARTASPNGRVRPAEGGDEWLRPISRVVPGSGAAAQLICFPYAGGGASAFCAWRSGAALDGIAVAAVQYPGHETRIAAARPSSVGELVADLRTGLADVWHGPFALFGHSFGAVVAWELTVALHRAGLSLPLRLFVAGARAPGSPRPSPIHQLPDREFLAAASAYGGIPEEVRRDPSLIGDLVALLRHDFRLMETHVEADATIPVPITALGGTGDAHVPVAALLGWASRSSKSFRVHMFDGDHFFPFGKAATAVAAAVAEDLRAVLPVRELAT